MKLKQLMAFGGTFVCLLLVGCSAGMAGTTASDPTPVPMSGGGVTVQHTERTIVATTAAWATPTGRVSCRGDIDGIRCEPTAKPAWTLRAPANCKTPTALRITAGGVQVDCTGSSAIGAARLGTTLTSWWREGRDPQIRVQGVPQAALGYGSTIQLGAFVCTALQVGLTCVDTRTGQGFEMSSESVSIQ